MKKIKYSLYLFFGFFVVVALSGCPGSKSNPAPVPTADFGFTVLNHVPPATINFSNKSQNANAYSWDFGDNTNSNGVSPTHVYTQNGVYTVTLVANGDGGKSQSTTTVTIGAETMTITSLTIDSAFQVSNPLYFLATVSIGNVVNTLPPYYLPPSNSSIYPAGYWNALNFISDVQSTITISLFFRFPGSTVNNAEGSSGNGIFSFKPGNYTLGSKAYPSKISLSNGTGAGETKITMNVSWQ